MKTITSKVHLLVTVFMLLGCLSIHAADNDLTTNQITVTLLTAGTLPDQISDTEKYQITNLKVVGDINGTDLRLIREMAGRDINGAETSGKLAILDLSEANIVRGGIFIILIRSFILLMSIIKIFAIQRTIRLANMLLKNAN